MESSKSSEIGSSSYSSSSLAVVSSDGLESQLSTAESIQQPPTSRYYILLIPDHGSHEVLGFDNIRRMIKTLMQYLNRKSRGKFKGEILAFRGAFIEYSDPVLSVRFNLPGEGEFSVSESSKGKYTRKVPKPE